MKAIIVGRQGLEIGEIPQTPVPTGKVLVKVHYAGVGFADVMAVQGGYPLAPAKPFSPGYEFSGTIAESGQRVAGMLRKMGTYREYVAADPRYLAPIPDGVDDRVAAAIPLNYLTAWGMMYENPLPAGASFLVHGAAGGVGQAMLDYARLHGLRAFGSAAPARRDIVEASGATWFDSGSDWESRLRELAPNGLDAAFDAYGIKSMRRDWRVLGKKGRLVAYGFSPTSDGGWGPFLRGAVWLVLRGLGGGGRSTRIFSLPMLMEHRPSWFRKSLSEILGLTAHGAIQVPIHGSLPWHDAEKAHAVLAQRQAKGKLLLDFQ